MRDPPPPGSPEPAKPSLWARSPVLRILTRLAFSSVLGVVVLTGAILGHDALTYGSHHVGKVDVHPLALKPEKGGPKNLPILAHDISELEDADQRKDKPRLVIVGGGWGVRICLACWVCASMEADLVASTTAAHTGRRPAQDAPRRRLQCDGRRTAELFSLRAYFAFCRPPQPSP